MVIDLTSPLWGGIAAGVVVSSFLGIYAFARVSLGKQLAEKKLLDLISELELLQKEHKKEITDIKNSNLEVVKKALDLYSKKLNEIINDAHSESPRGSLAELARQARRPNESINRTG